MPALATIRVFLLLAVTAAWAADLCSTNRLSLITFFDGKPADKASLVYDEIVETKDGSRATWHLTPDSVRGYYLVCTYEKRAKPVTQRLSPKLTTCVVEYGKPAEVSKLPPVRSVRCR